MGAPWGKGSKGTGKGKGKGKAKGKGAKGAGKEHWVEVKPLVCVTGCSGYLALHVVQRLLDKSYRVRGTVRSISDDAKVGPIKKMFPKLELYEADLLGGGEAFEKAFQGCKYVMHCASPFQLSGVSDPQKELVDPALKGTETVLNAAVKVGVERAVVTGSCAAIGPPQTWMGDLGKIDKEMVFTEQDWNTTSSLKEGPYRYAKTVAEKKAFEIAEQNKDKVSVATICPSFIIGPMLTNRVDGESAKLIKGVLDGSLSAAGPLKGCPLGVVDVRDVAFAHVGAMEIAEAGGKRFIVSSEKAYNKIELCDFLGDKFKAYPVPTEGDRHPCFGYSPEKAKDILKVKLRPAEVSMRDMASAAVRMGIVEQKFVKKPVKWGAVQDINPDSKGVNVLVKVVSLGKAEEMKSGAKIQEVVVGDASAIVTLRLTEAEMACVEVGKIIEVQNAATRMQGGFAHLSVGKWGKVARHAAEVSIAPKMAKDVSATEYELVDQ